MSDQELDSENYEEVAPQETEQGEFQDVEDSNHEESPKEDDAQERNWRAMRQRQKELEWELKKRDEMLEKALSRPSYEAPPIAVPEEPELDESEYAVYGGVKKLARQTVEPLEKKVQELEAKLAQTENQARFKSLKKTYPDYDDVVNIETLEILEKEQPELARDIAEMKDPYKMGLYSYKFIKSEGILDKLPSSRREKDIEKRIEKNSKTVQTPLAYEKRPMAKAFKATKADKKRIYEEMMYYASQAGGL